MIDHCPEGAADGSQGQAQRSPWSPPPIDRILKGCETTFDFSHPFRMRRQGELVSRGFARAQPLATFSHPFGVSIAGFIFLKALVVCGINFWTNFLGADCFEPVNTRRNEHREINLFGNFCYKPLASSIFFVVSGRRRAT
jgi:hypothetical protein